MYIYTYIYIYIYVYIHMYVCMHIDLKRILVNPGVKGRAAEEEARRQTEREARAGEL